MIRSTAFELCWALQSLVFPLTVQTIEKDALSLGQR